MPIKKINVEEFKLILIRFSEIQEALVAAFLELSKTKGQWPTKGTILLNNERWAYRKHGAGVCFTSKNTGEEIDAHSGIEQKPYKKDSWRLEIYFASLDRKIVSFNQRTYDSHIDCDIKCLMSKLANQNELKAIGYTSE
ncbi:MULTISPECIES: DUF6896 domain-containing protein [Pseudomonas]|jgi:hypothetical protein|uniref:DUF6896 domain-containing protein n=1 Tax=Pseudomonas urmiensis TaxID=2745493 RepID=A0A923G1C6_9PSED|nr:hypothetical protein [Pseudomonas urmiensis]MBV4535239.1 hypothetical protein [Pseudomonas urmiensis]